jgi:peptide/nickel transport system permease protein
MSNAEAVAAKPKLKSRRHKTGPWIEAWYRMRRNKRAMIGLGIVIFLLVLAIFPKQLSPYGEDEQVYSDMLQFPNAKHWLGTDAYGRDMLSRLIYGTRVSMAIGLLSMLVSLTVGGTLGLISAYYGDKVDNIIMRGVDILMALPSFLLAIAITASLGAGFTVLIFAISIGKIPMFARIARASALTVKGQEYIEAARAIGASPFRLMVRHILPNSLAPIIVQATLGVASAILASAGLSFLGLGVQPPTAEWGFMLNSGRQFIRSNWYIVTFPGMMIMLSIYGLNMLGDGLRDALDPKLKR